MKKMKNIDDNSLISVIVAIYNVDEYLENCIESIISQTYSNLEIILVVDDVDDISQKNCGKICEDYAKQDTRIKVIHKEHKGLISARKAGLKIATGIFSAFVDGDDWIEPQLYEHMYEMIRKYNVSFVETGVIDSLENGCKYRISNYDEGSYKDDKYKNDFIGRILKFSNEFYQQGMTSYLWNKLFKTEILRACYEDVDYSGSSVLEDYVVTLPYAFKASSVYISHECYYHYRVVYNSGKRTLNKKMYSEVSHALSLINKAANDSIYKEYIDGQLPVFMLYILIWFCPYIFDNSSETILHPYGGVQTKEKVVLYGAGAVGISLYNYMSSVMGENNITWVDADYKHLERYYAVKSPEIIKTINYDKIIIAIFRNSIVKYVKKWLEENGVKKEKIYFVDEKYIEDPKLLLNYTNCSF